MTSLRSKLNRFFFNNRDRGVRNLMLYIAIGNVIVFLLTLLNTENPIFYEALRFNGSKILSGELWRLFSYPLVYLTELSSPLLGLISLFFYYWCGSILDQYWGSLRFNLYYLCGVVFTDLAGILVSVAAAAELGEFGAILSGLPFITAEYVNMSLLLAVATVLPDQMIRIYFIIPVKMKWLAWVDIGLTLYGMIDTVLKLLRYGLHAVSVYLLLLIPLVSIVNYLLFFGKEAANILPDFIRYRPTRKSWQRQVRQKNVYADAGLGRGGNRNAETGQARFRCTVCGRTELTNPGLEFRYCSKCAGYRCYCQDHIHNHTHITE